MSFIHSLVIRRSRLASLSVVYRRRIRNSYIVVVMAASCRAFHWLLLNFNSSSSVSCIPSCNRMEKEWQLPAQLVFDHNQIIKRRRKERKKEKETGKNRRSLNAIYDQGARRDGADDVSRPAACPSLSVSQSIIFFFLPVLRLLVLFLLNRHLFV